MSKHGIVRVFFVAACLGLVAGGPLAWADEPPPSDFPPPVAPKDEPTPPPAAETDETKPPPTKPAAETSDEQPDGEPSEEPSEEPAKKPASWSPPATTPGSTSGALPPPQIVRRGGATAPRATPSPAVPSGRTPEAGTMPAAPRPPIVDVPTTRPIPPPPPLPLAPGATPTVTAPARPTAPRAFPTARTATRVFSVAKTHNVPLGNGDLALQLDVDYEVHAQDGRDVYVGIWFVRADTGQHIRSAVSTYADSDGFVTLQTRTARVRGNAARFAATLRIPYRAFPVARANESYEVEARVQILRDAGRGLATSLGRGTTTFRVYGYAEDEAPDDDAETP